jgi:glycine dehydrogenase
MFDPRPSDHFAPRHLGPRPEERQQMLATLGLSSLGELIDQTVPDGIRLGRELDLPQALGERRVLEVLGELAGMNQVLRSYIGQGYYPCIVPPVIQRNVLENPAWYTQYTPYQAEISQGRLEALLNYQTAVTSLCGLPLANASLLDEGTAAAEALSMCHAAGRSKHDRYLVDERCHPQTLEVVRTRAAAVGVELVVADAFAHDFDAQPVAAVLVQTPDTHGRLHRLDALAERAHAAGAKLIAASDLLALVLATPPGEQGADVVIGSAQRFGVPLGFGGPHAAFMAAKEEFKRLLPGRIIGVSVDARGERALRMAMQTREQHIRRDKATSNICTAQVLLAVMSGFYAIYHGAEGLRAIARRVHGLTELLAAELSEAGFKIADGPRFDTLRITAGPLDGAALVSAARNAGFLVRDFGDGSVGVSLDERTTLDELVELLDAWGRKVNDSELADRCANRSGELDADHARESAILDHPVFERYRTEHGLLRYMHQLQERDLSLVHSMIPLGSCTMKLNATSQMLPVTWPEFGELHPFAPADTTAGYTALFNSLESALEEITGFAGVSLQPNAGSQGEYAGLLCIKSYLESEGQGHRNICLIPTSAHGTNPASAVMAGFKVVAVKCDERGNIDLADLRAKAEKHGQELAALMITYPSTHGVFESGVAEACQVIHDHGGQVYLDGANLNAQVGLCRPGDYGADVCHLNLHKTFCIPHGGGGPGMGPIGVAEHLVPHLPGHRSAGIQTGSGAVSAAPYGSASILTISWVYIMSMGPIALRESAEIAILNANYMAKRLEEHYPVLYRGERGRVAHEFILDLRPYEKRAHVSAEDVAKRLMDYGFHAPTMSWPVAGTIMVEPTESEPLEELDRFCDALISIRQEIARIESGEWSTEDNPLVNAPHPASTVLANEWKHGYTREEAAFPAPWTRERKFWPHVARIDNGYGDRNLICTCPSVEALAEPEAAEAEALGV